MSYKLCEAIESQTLSILYINQVENGVKRPQIRNFFRSLKIIFIFIQIIVLSVNIVIVSKNKPTHDYFNHLVKIMCIFVLDFIFYRYVEKC